MADIECCIGSGAGSIHLFLLVRESLFVIYLFSIMACSHSSILPESPRWLVSKQRYEDAEILLRHIAERNKTEFNAAKYERFVQEDKKVGRPMIVNIE